MTLLEDMAGPSRHNGRKTSLKPMVLALPAALALLASGGSAHAQVFGRRYDPPLNLRPVEPAWDVGGEIGHPFYRNRFSLVARPYFGIRLRPAWELTFTVPFTIGNFGGGAVALGNIEVLAMVRWNLGPHVRMALAFGGYAPTHSGFDGAPGNEAWYWLRYDGLWSTGGYMQGYYTPGHVIPHVHLGFAWNPNYGIFTLSWEVGSDLRIRVSNSGWYNRVADLSIFAGVFFGVRVHRVVSVGGGVRFYEWVSQNSNYSRDEGYDWAGVWSVPLGVRFHAGAFEPGVGAIFTVPSPFRAQPGDFFQGGAIYADLRARFY